MFFGANFNDEELGKLTSCEILDSISSEDDAIKMYPATIL